MVVLSTVFVNFNNNNWHVLGDSFNINVKINTEDKYRIDSEAYDESTNATICQDEVTIIHGVDFAE